MRRIPALGVALAATLALAVPTLATGSEPEAHAASSVNVPKVFGQKKIDKAASLSGVDVLLPTRIGTNGIKPSRIRGSVGELNGGYDLQLGVGRNCNGANACFVAAFFGNANGEIVYTKKVKLAGGKTGYFKPVTCGASCSPAAIQWKIGDVVYEIQYKGASQKKEKATMIGLANSANKAGAR
jgi:hypothetical protein